ncbi:hypothetical protein SLH46_06260 [Draconibacterium sp. IB214405]|uniref:hypothetical protein n=1 Tax=Draconibacterium sp. IB214405 TaxID=3097352 RepID=UPI002A13318A|nr:hypothetical protein [Draconibacterium sp. IB214405]MDX8338775.1 hypothetical protein [Draconibacterium sp. IB214405]
MNQNQVFKNFIKNPDLKEYVDISENQMKKMDLFNPSSDKLIEVIKTVILHTEDESSIDLSARRVNQLFKK